jgi:hypothetical protein
MSLPSPSPRHPPAKIHEIEGHPPSQAARRRTARPLDAPAELTHHAPAHRVRRAPVRAFASLRLVHRSMRVIERFRLPL